MAAAPINRPAASIDKRFMNVALPWLLLVGRQPITATRGVNPFFMLQLRCATFRFPLPPITHAATRAIANAYVMWLIASMFFKPRVAIVCGSAFLLMPATLRYGLILLPANLAMLGVSVALLFMLRYLQSADAGRGRSLDLGLSALAFFLACITSWEPFLALPGLLLAYAFNRRSEIFKTCFCWAIAAIAAGASTLAIYSLSDSTFLGDLWSIFTFRLGLTQYLPLSARVHPVEGQLETIESLNVFSSAASFFRQLTSFVRRCSADRSVSLASLR